MPEKSRICIRCGHEACESCKTWCDHMLYFRLGDSSYEPVSCCDGACLYAAGDALEQADAASNIVKAETTLSASLGVTIPQLYLTHAAVPVFCGHDECDCPEWEVRPLAEARDKVRRYGLINPPPRLTGDHDGAERT